MTHAMIDSGPLDLAAIVAANVRAEASRRGWGSTSLSRALGVSHSAISKRWRGVQDWQLADLVPVAEVLGVDVAVLLDTTTAATSEGSGRSARLKGLEPPTFWLGVVAPVIDIFSRERVA